MKHPLLTLAAIAAATVTAHAAVEVVTGYLPGDDGFKFPKIAPPAVDDAAAKATFTLVGGSGDGNGGGLAALHDGRVPGNEDDPGSNFFLNPGGEGGKLQIDLGKAISIANVASYSWHKGTRAPQIYKLYGSAADTAPGADGDLIKNGWKPIAKVDTRPLGGKTAGGQYAAQIQEHNGGPIGSYRYLLMEISNPAEPTFYSEIDVVEANGAALKRAEKVAKTFESPDHLYTYVVDASNSPDLMPWAEKNLVPMAREWYPKLAALLPGTNYKVPPKVVLRFKDDMKGVPAYATGEGISLNAPWFRQNLKGEALGCVVHEMTHIVQNYGIARSRNPHPKPVPGWIIEGIPDYMRWFLFEPQSHGAEITKGNVEKAKYTDSYRVSANFLDWVVRTHDKNLIAKLNAAARDGNYDEALWKEWTGLTLEELGAAWHKANEDRLAAQK